MPDLETRWTKLMRTTTSADLALAIATFEDLYARYGEPHRHYHTLDHIVFCLDVLDRFGEAAHDPLAIELALWFHDAVYIPRSPWNEIESARLAVASLSRLSVPQKTIESVAALVRSTDHSADITRSKEERDIDRSLVHDIDLAILGSDIALYNSYSSNIRREYERMDPVQFAAGRAVILKSFLNSQAIYLTQPIAIEFEQAARNNMQREIESLQRRIT